MLYSVSAYEGQDVFNDPFHYLKRQAGCAFLGFIGMFIVSVIPCEWWKKLSFPIYVLSFLMCAAVIVVGKGSNGSTRWLKIGSIQLQPSEIAKIAVIIFMAALLSRIPKQVKDLKSIIKVLLFVLPMVGVIAVSNLSTAIIVGCGQSEDKGIFRSWSRSGRIGSHRCKNGWLSCDTYCCMAASGRLSG